MMFKILLLLLQTWYGLSDYEVEERINDSLLFSEFPLLDICSRAPNSPEKLPLGRMILPRGGKGERQASHFSA